MNVPTICQNWVNSKNLIFWCQFKMLKTPFKIVPKEGEEGRGCSSLWIFVTWRFLANFFFLAQISSVRFSVKTKCRGEGEGVPAVENPMSRKSSLHSLSLFPSTLPSKLCHRTLDIMMQFSRLLYIPWWLTRVEVFLTFTNLFFL